MGFFDKKYCDVCGEKLGLLGNRKLEDGNLCKSCASLLSPFTTDRRKTNLSEIKEHLAYREENKAKVSEFNATRSLGGRTKVILDEDARKFIVTSSSRWQNDNPDVIDFSQVTGCETEIKERKTEIMWKDKEGKDISYNPRRYDIDYDFFTTIHINSPWFNEILIKINDSRVEHRGSAEYNEMQSQANDIKTTLTQVRQEIRENITASNTPKMSKVCPLCGATTIPNASGCCEFCGGAINS